MTEWEVFSFFAQARRESTGRILAEAVRSERPDILATCSRLGPVGIEITDARPEMSENDIDFHEELLQEEVFDYFDAALAVFTAITVKERKRVSSGWQRPDATILLIRCFSDIRALLDHYGTVSRSDVIPEHGFQEIWVQDYELSFAKDGEVVGSAVICLHPPYWWRRRLIYRVHRHPSFPFTVRRDYVGD